MGTRSHMGGRINKKKKNDTRLVTLAASAFWHSNLWRYVLDFFPFFLSLYSFVRSDFLSIISCQRGRARAGRRARGRKGQKEIDE